MLTKQELQTRKNSFYELMSRYEPDWNVAVIVDKVNQYYFTGTMQNGVLVFLPKGDMHYFVKKSYDRAKIESPINNIHSMNSYQEIVSIVGNKFDN